MEIEIGDFVRTEKGKIFKYGKGRTYLGKNNKIVKHSKNIIDLIEVGDYVNGHLVVEKYIDIDDNGNDFITIEVESDLMLHKSLVEKHIKSIVTKEQFKNIEYRLE